MAEKKEAKKVDKEAKEKKKEEKKVVEKKEAKAEKKEDAKKGKKTREELERELLHLKVLKYPLITEKAVNMIDSENKLTFVIDSNATKMDVKASIEELYGVKVRGVNIQRDMKARKRAIVTIDKKYKADDIATKIGVI
ncbi:MAG: 50S ribosomal protein L23 [archaeon]|nr:50S ribosomal protein L23 [archaeon]